MDAFLILLIIFPTLLRTLNLMERDWKTILLRLLKCWGHIHDDWYEEYWHKFGISREEGQKIIEEYKKYK